MSEEMIACKCGFKSVASQWYKTDGLCPACNKPLANKALREKFGGVV